jgi:hypothetical protein
MHHISFISRRRLLACSAGAVLVLPMRGTRRTIAARQSPEASPGPEADTLFEVAFPRDWQPEGLAQGAFYRIILQPGDELTYLPGPYCGCSGETIKEGTAAERVMSGVYTIRIDRPFILRRPGEEDREIEADEEVELVEGDVAIYPDALAFGSLRNAGDEPVTLFGASITSVEVEEGTFTPPLPEEMSARLSVAVANAWETLGEGDIMATLTRRELAPGGQIGPYEIVGLEAIHAVEGEFHSSLIAPGEDAPAGDPLYVRQGGSSAFRKVTPGTRRLIENPFETPATLLTLTFTAAP